MSLKSPDSEVSNKNDQNRCYNMTIRCTELSRLRIFHLQLTTQNWPTVSLDFFSLTAAAP